MFGWLSAATARASRSKRRRRSGSAAKSSGRTLTATSRPRRGSRARYTSPMPPAPRSSSDLVGPEPRPCQKRHARASGQSCDVNIHLSCRLRQAFFVHSWCRRFSREACETAEASAGLQRTSLTGPCRPPRSSGWAAPPGRRRAGARCSLAWAAGPAGRLERRRRGPEPVLRGRQPGADRRRRLQAPRRPLREEGGLHRGASVTTLATVPAHPGRAGRTTTEARGPGRLLAGRSRARPALSGCSFRSSSSEPGSTWQRSPATGLHPRRGPPLPARTTRSLRSSERRDRR